MGDAQSHVETSANGGPFAGEYDVFLSHASPDKPWALTLRDKLATLGLRVFLDELEIKPADNWVIRLSDALERSRYMVLLLSDHTTDGPWVVQEWTSWMAGHGPLGRLLPVKIDAVDLPFILKSTQSIDAIHRDAQQTADALFAVVGDPATLPSDDARRLVIGRDLVFALSRDDEHLTVVPPGGEPRQVPLPWKQDNRFGIAHLGFTKLHQLPAADPSAHSELFRHARTLGGLLFAALFDESDTKSLEELIGPANPRRPVIQVRSDDALLLALPWELLHHNEAFLVREGQVDLIRTIPAEAAGETLLREATAPFKLVVNVSAPAGSHLSYEAESYRITLATAERCEMVPTELGTLDDLVETVYRETPAGVHFSGHGKPGALLFESDRGLDDEVPVDKVLDALHRRLPDDRPLPPFFYLASCHGNEPAGLEEDEPGSASAAVQLHRAGVAEVVGYFGPILDELSTRAEETLYEAIAEGLPTRDAVRLARQALARPVHAPDGRHRPSRAPDAPVTSEVAVADTHPFAWVQLVFYRRGPEWPLSVPMPAGKRRGARTLKRSFVGVGDRRVLSTGFIGRRVEQHRIRQRLDEGVRVFVFQGLGGLGKSTLAQRILPWLTDDGANTLTLWCQEVEGEPDRAEALVGQLLDYCRNRFGLDWEGVVQQVDQVAGDDSGARFVYYLHTLVQNAPELVLYLDNLESLLVGPADDSDSAAFAEWADPALEVIWRNATQMAEDSGAFYLVASCRYRNDAFGDALLPVSPLPADALFRLTEWFPALQRLTAHSRARLVDRLDGHPRAVEYANDLVADALTRWRNTQGEWSLPAPPGPEDLTREWESLVNPALPKVAERLKDNLLLRAIWDQVLDARERRFLCRMAVLRHPADWSLLGVLGDPDEPEETAFATADRLRDTSLLEQMELFARADKDRIETITRYALHPATVQFILEAQAEAAEFRLAAHRRIGEHLEAEAKDSPYIETVIEAGHHLFEAGFCDRAGELLGSASEWLRNRGRVREGLRVLAPFLADSVQARMDPASLGRLLGTAGNAHRQLSEVEQAIGYYEQTLVITREIGDRRGEGNAFGSLGLAYARLGEVEQAIGYYEQALVISREIGDRRGEGNRLGNLGVAYASLGEVEKAIGYYEQALVISREIGDRRGERNRLGNLGNAYASLGEVEKGIGYYEQALVISREIGDRQGEGNSLGNLGNAYASLGEVEKAIGYYGQQIVITREIGDRRGEGAALGNLGNAYARLGEVEKAIGYYEQQLVITREIGDRRGEGNGLGNVGVTYASLGEVEKAIGYLEQAKDIGEQIGDPRIVQFATSELERLSKLDDQRLE